MEKIKLDINSVLKFVSEKEIRQIESEEATKAIDMVKNGTGEGNDFLGWYDLPSRTSMKELDEIIDVANDLRNSCEYVVSVGIGGSYLGAKAVIEALNNSFDAYTSTSKGAPKVLFAGQNIGEEYLAELQEFLKDKKFGIIVISKSGTTTEPAIAFRLLKEQLEAQAGKEAAKNLIVAITDAKRGALRQLATEEGYRTFVIEDNVGGRFSVLTPVGLLPIAVAGYDIKKLVKGAVEMEKELGNASDSNMAELYASTRNALYRAGKKTEILVNYNPKLHFFGEWWKQLYGESEGKDQKGIFPASVDLTTDLHSMGQFIQDGARIMFETVMNVEKSRSTVELKEEPVDLDGLNYLAGKDMDFVNKSAMNGTILAHTDGNVPNLMVKIPEQNEFYLGELFYFFEFACGVSGYILGVNPFNQPGVESYKRNMFALLGKPGYEAEREALLKRL